MKLAFETQIFDDKFQRQTQSPKAGLFRKQEGELLLAGSLAREEEGPIDQDCSAIFRKELGALAALPP